MRAWDFLIEDYKTTAVKFVASGIDQAQVDDYILKFKELSNQQKLAGDEKNIDTWAKKPFSNFKEFVDAKETEVADTANKKAEKIAQKMDYKDKSNSIDITTPEQRSAGWNILIPLNKEASCDLGTPNWCIAQPKHDYFNQYFYSGRINLIFCLNDKKEKWAITIPTSPGDMDDLLNFFDKNNKEISKSEFEKQTKLNFADILRSYKPYIDKIKAVKQLYFDKKSIERFQKLQIIFPDATLETWHTHPLGGGWVQNTAGVADTAFVGPDAIVSGKADVSDIAQVSENAEVSGNAQVFGFAAVSGSSKVSENARVYGFAAVSQNAQVSGRSQVYGRSWVSGDAAISEKAQVYEAARVSGNSRVFGSSRVYGHAIVSGNAEVSGKALVAGRSRVSGNALVSGNARVSGNEIVEK
jgi:carbonic anhydrase/acetyltransferase-like protein (isoleucine patch superfamily)